MYLPSKIPIMAISNNRIKKCNRIAKIYNLVLYFIVCFVYCDYFNFVLCFIVYFFACDDLSKIVFLR